jgi:hypothetical protein
MAWNTFEVGRSLRANTSLKKVHPASSRALLHGCMAAWPLVLRVQLSHLPIRKYSPLSAEKAS